MEQVGNVLDFSRPDPVPKGLLALNYQSWSRQVTVTDEEWRDNIAACLERNLPEFTPALVRNKTALHIVGSGPSLGDEGVFDAIKAAALDNEPMIAVKDAHDWLIERGIAPDLAVLMDPQASRVSCVQRKNKQVGYLIASQCHPDVFEWLKDQQVIVWHGASDGSEDKLLKGKMKVCGGSTSGLRTLVLGYLMGFRRFVLYGFDSCLRNGIKRVTGAKATEKTIGVRAGIDGEEFICNGAMAAQATEFQLNYIAMPDMQVRVVGGGLIAAIIEERKRLNVGGYF